MSSAHGSGLPSDLASQEFKEVQLVLDGYTVSTDMAVLARIADRYVMRNRDGRQVVVPALISTDHLTRAWTAFRRLAEINVGLPVDRAAIGEPAA